jgi:CHAD domain-containing protein
MPTVRRERKGREVARKYVADDGFELPSLTEMVVGADGRWNGGGAPVVESEPVWQQFAATHFDTADLRLAAAGLTLRRRTCGDDAGWHLSGPAGRAARSEVRLPLGRGARTVPESLQQMVWAQSLGSALRPSAEVMTDRTVRRLVDATGHVVAEVADDRVTARRLLPTEGTGDAATAAESWREIEIEVDLAEVAEDLLSAVDVRLREQGLSDAPGVSRLTQILDLPRRNSTGSDELTVTSPAGDVLLAHLQEQVRQVRAQDLPVRLDAADAVHKMRVATRRLRSALTTFKPLFEPDVVGPLRNELRWLAGELGAARDAEVMRDRVLSTVEAQKTQAGEAEPAAVVADSELGGAYRKAHDRVLAELDEDRYHAILRALDGLVTAPPVTDRAEAPAGETLPPLVARSYKKVRRIVKQADATPAGAEREELLHDARKAAKRARYAAESVSRVFGADAVAFAEAMEAVQEALGEHQDSVLTRERLRELARHTSSTEAAFFYGRLHALEEAGAAQSQRHFDAAWKAAGRKPLHRWLR